MPHPSDATKIPDRRKIEYRTRIQLYLMKVRGTAKFPDDDALASRLAETITDLIFNMLGITRLETTMTEDEWDDYLFNNERGMVPRACRAFISEFLAGSLAPTPRVKAKVPTQSPKAMLQALLVLLGRLNLFTRQF
jgi:hypothetical protein